MKKSCVQVSHKNTNHWLQFTTGTQNGSTKMEVCNLHISTGTEVSIFDEETKTCIFSENVISVALSGYNVLEWISVQISV
jgi:hypothetical protein